MRVMTLSLLITAVSCARPPERPMPAAVPSSTMGPSAPNPASPPAGPIDTKLAARIDAVLAVRGWVGASVAVWRGGRWKHVKGHGIADLRGDRPLTAETPLYAGSLSKVVTAAAVLRLQDEGKLDIEDAVGHWLPSLAESPVGSVTVRDLLEHRAGLSREGTFGYWFSGTFPGDADLMAELRSARAIAGAPRRYSSLGYALLGRIIAVASPDDGYAAFVQRTFFDPLGATWSRFEVAPAERAAIARGYAPPGRVLPNEAHPFAGLGATVETRRERLYHDPEAMAPAFGLLTTARELAALTRAVTMGEALAARSRRRLLDLLSLDRTHQLRTHTGWFAAHTSYLAVDPERDLVVVVLANSDDAEPGDIGRAIVEELGK